jgi:hypothetical protein
LSTLQAPYGPQFRWPWKYLGSFVGWLFKAFDRSSEFDQPCRICNGAFGGGCKRFGQIPRIPRIPSAVVSRWSGPSEVSTMICGPRIGRFPEYRAWRKPLSWIFGEKHNDQYYRVPEVGGVLADWMNLTNPDTYIIY